MTNKKIQNSETAHCANGRVESCVVRRTDRGIMPKLVKRIFINTETTPNPNNYLTMVFTDDTFQQINIREGDTAETSVHMLRGLANSIEKNQCINN